MFRRLLIAFVLLAGFLPLAKAQSETWVEVGTPHFLVVSNSAENEARRAGRQFELMRSAFQQIFPDAKLDTATPIVVLAVQDKTNLQALVPPAYVGKGKLTVAGLFVQAPEKNYILIWLNSPGFHPFAPIYHEYTHFVMSRTGEWMPLWLSEGFAEFYENTEIYSDEVRVGKVDAYLLDYLHQHPMLPLASLFTVDVHSPNYHQEDEGSAFYTESWALTHFLKTKDEHEGTHRLDDYLALVRGGTDNVAAATQAFGPLDMLQAELQKYLVNEDFGYIKMPGLLPIDESSFSTRAVPKLEADAVRAEFLSRVGRDGDARTLLESVLHDDPGNVSAYDTMGYMAYRSQNFDEARTWCEKAMALDAKDFLAQHCFAASFLKKGTTDAATLARIESSLRNVTRLNPAFAPAYDGLGTVLAIRGKYAESQQLMQKSVQLDPGNVELRLDQANAFMRMSKTQEAIHTLELALKIAHTPEQVAAVESVLQYSKRYEAERAKLQANNKTTVRLTAPDHAKTPGTTPARVIHSVQAEYSEQARAAKLEGVCVLSMIIGIDGTPGNIVVTKKLGMGLDAKAVAAVRQWKFEPARRNGRPVLSRLNLSVTFKLFAGQGGRFIELSQRARAGDPDAEIELANAFFDGHDIPKDEAQGMTLLERAAQGGLPRAQFQLAERLYGSGTNPDNDVAAYMWYSLAQRGGLQEPQARISELEGKMSAEKLTEAHRRVETWVPQLSK